jgi:hypothetical protein
MSDYAASLGKMNTGRNENRERALDKLFPSGPEFSLDGNDLHLETPFTIVDAEDNILAWYIPDIISRDAHVRSDLLWFLFPLTLTNRISGQKALIF